MLTEKNLRDIARKAFVQLKGEAWIRDHRDLIGDEYSLTPDENGEIEYRFIEDDCNGSVEFNSFEEWKQKLDQVMARPEEYNWRPRHSTTLFINADTGKVRIENHGEDCSYIESQEVFSSLFSDRAKYEAIRHVICATVYRNMRVAS